MCGLTGFFAPAAPMGPDAAKTVLGAMSHAIRRRGPDDHGIWMDCDAGIALAHNRLAIMDLSEKGHQPMLSPSERYVLVYNGEIYNHLDIRADIDGARPDFSWRGLSDTETFLAAIEIWGVMGAVERLIGMFAFALWDREARQLHLGRDRVGEKPLYYGWNGSGAQRSFIFGSELGACLCHPAAEQQIAPEAVALLLRHNYIPAPKSVFKSFSKLLPGYVLTLDAKEDTPQITQYWSVVQVVGSAERGAFAGDAQAAVEATEAVLSRAVERQMLSDVPLGAFLSGGIDSTAITALMQKASSAPVKTFSIGFENERYNEAKYAKKVAQHLGTEHHELYVTAQQALDVVPRLASIYSEPFADSSQIPTSIVAGLAREQVTVALSGDGGDELFCGYSRYNITDAFWARLQRVPYPLRKLLSAGIRSLPPGGIAALARLGTRALPRTLQLSDMPEKIAKAGRMLPSRDLETLYLDMVSHHMAPQQFLVAQPAPTHCLEGHDFGDLDGIARMMAFDTVTYLPDDILVKTDRASMYHSLELRAPFLDHTVLEHAWHLPAQFKLREGQSKWVLREIIRRHVPDQLMERPKMGFGVPLADWLRGPLRDWGAALLDRRRLAGEGIFAPDAVQGLWERHQSGRENNHHLLWNFLMFQAWLDTYQDKLPQLDAA